MSAGFEIERTFSFDFFRGAGRGENLHANFWSHDQARDGIDVLRSARFQPGYIREFYSVGS